MHLHGGWVAFAIFVFIIVSLFIFGLIDDAKEKEKSKPQMTYPHTPKKEMMSEERADYVFSKIVGTLAGIIIVVVPFTILYIIAIQF